MYIFNGGWLLGDPEEVWQCQGEVHLAGFRVHALALPLGRSVTFGRLLNNLCELFPLCTMEVVVLFYKVVVRIMSLCSR